MSWMANCLSFLCCCCYSNWEGQALHFRQEMMLLCWLWWTKEKRWAHWEGQTLPFYDLSRNDVLVLTTMNEREEMSIHWEGQTLDFYQEMMLLFSLQWRKEKRRARTCESSWYAGLLGCCALHTIITGRAGCRVRHLRTSIAEESSAAVTRGGRQGVAIAVLTQQAWQRGSTAGWTVCTWRTHRRKKTMEIKWIRKTNLFVNVSFWVSFSSF